MNDSLSNKWSRNSEDAVKNRLLDVMMAVVSEQSSTHETRMPLDNTTDEMKDMLSDIEELISTDTKRSPFRFVSGSFMTDKKIEFAISKGGIGPFALGNANHPLTQMTGLRFKDFDILTRFNMQRLDRVYGNDGSRILDWLISPYICACRRS